MEHLTRHFHSYYLWCDDTDASKSYTKAALVDPLSKSSQVKKLDSIKGSAGES
jgi:hypothetical protein